MFYVFKGLQLGKGVKLNMCSKHSQTQFLHRYFAAAFHACPRIAASFTLPLQGVRPLRTDNNLDADDHLPVEIRWTSVT